jgi:hypothetical protein
MRTTRAASGLLPTPSAKVAEQQRAMEEAKRAQLEQKRLREQRQAAAQTLDRERAAMQGQPAFQPPSTCHLTRFWTLRVRRSRWARVGDVLAIDAGASPHYFCSALVRETAVASAVRTHRMKRMKRRRNSRRPIRRARRARTTRRARIRNEGQPLLLEPCDVSCLNAGVGLQGPHPQGWQAQGQEEEDQARRLAPWRWTRKLEPGLSGSFSRLPSAFGLLSAQLSFWATAVELVDRRGASPGEGQAISAVDAGVQAQRSGRILALDCRVFCMLTLTRPCPSQDANVFAEKLAKRASSKRSASSSAASASSSSSKFDAVRIFIVLIIFSFIPPCNSESFISLCSSSTSGTRATVKLKACRRHLHLMLPPPRRHHHHHQQQQQQQLATR